MNAGAPEIPSLMHTAFAASVGVFFEGVRRHVRTIVIVKVSEGSIYQAFPRQSSPPSPAPPFGGRDAKLSLPEN